MIKVALIPIDNRPICYDLIRNIADIDDNIRLYLPPLADLGGLVQSADINNIFKFLEDLDFVDYLIISLDTLAYGGLVSSRRCDDTYDEIKERIEKFKNIASKKAKKILAFSSIMRISNNNINEEEKEYWNKYGKKIFDWSYNSHKLGDTETDIPKEILDDYLKTRKRNFDINKIYLSWAQQGFFNYLILSKDDCAQYGLNVAEATELQKIINENNILNAQIKTGADEIPLSLLSRALSENENIKIKPLFLEPDSKNLISKYEDIPIYNCALDQINLAGCDTAQDSADLILVINNFKKEQGDLVLGDIINNIEKDVNFPCSPYFIADTNNANGADNSFIEQLFKELSKGMNNFFGYCGYNTSANTLGCAICTAIVKFIALKHGTYNDSAFKKLQFIRFLDDWAYQAISRKYIREKSPDFISALQEKKEELNKNALKIEEHLNYKPDKIDYSLPWDRSFEIRITID